MNKFIKSFNYIIFFYLLLTFFLVRTAAGIYILNFRLGEYYVFFGVLLSLILIPWVFKNRDKNEFFNSTINILLIIYSSFLVNLFIYFEGNYTTYIFKSSSYLWFIVFLYIGLTIKKDINLITIFYNVGIFGIYIIYLVKVSGFFIDGDENNFIDNYFLSISDKFELHKGSDLLILYIIIMMLNNYIFTKKYKKEYFIFTSAVFLPLLLYSSRAAFIAGCIFFTLEVLNNKEIYLLKQKKLIYATLFLALFAVSSSVVQSRDIQPDGAFESIRELAEYRNTIDSEKGNGNLFWVSSNRLYSSDGNLNWRLQIWQDTISDLITDQKLFLGNGYYKMIPSMQLDKRQGMDGLNENVHNFLINTLARGGLLQLVLIVLIYLKLIQQFYKKNNNFRILLYLIPCMFVSFFDSSMENAHFPLFFYYFFGYFLRNLKTK